MSRYKRPSLETILTSAKEARSLGDWSMVWSTENVPGMDNAVGSRTTTFRLYGRRKLRYRALVTGSMLSMHCRVGSATTVNGFFMFIAFLTLAVFGLANPMRHFEVYLGEWSINGPGRAFRMVPMLDGIGIAISIHAFVRAICNSCMASIAGIYVMHTISDLPLPYTFCRDFSLKPYEPNMKKLKLNIYLLNRSSSLNAKNQDSDIVNLASRYQYKVSTCNETYKANINMTPAYNFFYVEVMHYRESKKFDYFNISLIIGIVFVWSVIWAFLILEKVTNGRLVWNNIHVWFLMVPLIWNVVIVSTASFHLIKKKIVLKSIETHTKDFFEVFTEAMIVALYFHASSIGTNLIFGKGLNHYGILRAVTESHVTWREALRTCDRNEANGHIDPMLNEENVWYSLYTLFWAMMNSSGVFMCSIVDSAFPKYQTKLFGDRQSTLWILPMYSYCMNIGHFTRLISTVVYFGLMISYMVMSYIMFKSALHTIFEYKVKLVFIEQYLVAGSLIICMLLTCMFTTSFGLPLLEIIDSLNINIAMPLICLLELIAYLYVYRAHDFVSDMNIATEENTCSTRIDTQWKIIPFVVALCLASKIIYTCSTQIDVALVMVALVPLACIVLALPIKGAVNAYIYKIRRT